jgi:hypothetical protein
LSGWIISAGYFYYRGFIMQDDIETSGGDSAPRESDYDISAIAGSKFSREFPAYILTGSYNGDSIGPVQTENNLYILDYDKKNISRVKVNGLTGIPFVEGTQAQTNKQNRSNTK